MTAVTAAVFALPTTGVVSYPILQGLLLSAAGLAVARRIMVMNERQTRDSILAYSGGVIEHTIFLGGVYLLGQLSGLITPPDLELISPALRFTSTILVVGLPFTYLLSKIVEGNYSLIAAMFYSFAVTTRYPPLQQYAVWRSRRALHRTPETRPDKLDRIAAFDPIDLSAATRRDWLLSALIISGRLWIYAGFVAVSYLLFGNLLLSVGLIVATWLFHDATQFLFHRYGLQHHHTGSYYLALFGPLLPVYLFAHLLVIP